MWGILPGIPSGLRLVHVGKWMLGLPVERTGRAVLATSAVVSFSSSEESIMTISSSPSMIYMYSGKDMHVWEMHLGLEK